MNLEELRRKIDELDEQIIDLLNKRAEVVIEVGKIKHVSKAPIYSPDRERFIFEKVVKVNRGPLPDAALKAIWRELMSASFALEKPIRIAYLGPEGSFSHLAATEKFGSSVEYEAVADIAGVFTEVSRRHADFGVVPVENSTGGGVIDTLDAFIDSDVKICAEINRAIRHSLLANCRIEQIERVYSKPEVFAQCQRWLSETGLAAKTIPVASTSKAAEMAGSEQRAAAIGSALAAELYRLGVVTENIEDNPNNVTRFVVVGRSCAQPTGDDKTAMMFITAHKAGALADMLAVFKQNGINLTFIQSRPSKKRNWEYYFFVDAEGHMEDENVATAIGQGRAHCRELDVLGSFPRAGEVL